MRKLLMVGAVLAAVVFPTASRAQLSLGLRLGYGAAMGDYADAASGSGSLKMSDIASSQIPIQLDGMYKLNPEWALGVYFSYGFASVSGAAKDICTATGEDCSASSMRFGVQGTYTFAKAGSTFLPWLGVGLGWEWLSIKESLGGLSATTDTSGFEFLNLQVGGDWKLNEKVAMGPYLMYSIGQYSSIEGNDIPNKTMHEWFNVGVRGKFDL